MADRLAVTSRRTPLNPSSLFGVFLIALMTLAWTGASWGEEPTKAPVPAQGPTTAPAQAGPDFDAFRAAKQTYHQNPAQAADQFRTFIEHYRESPWTPEAYYWVAKSLETAKADRAEVLKAYMQFLRSYPAHDLADDASFAIAELYRNRSTGNEDFDRALERYEKFIKEYPGSDRVAEAWFRVGDVQLVRQRYDKGLEAFGKVVSDFPQSPFALPARIGTGMCLARLKRTDEATALFNELLKTPIAEHDELRVRLGLLSAKLSADKLDEAKAEAERIRAETDKRGHDQDWVAFDSYRQISEYYQRNHALDKAVEEMKGYLTRYPGSWWEWSTRTNIADFELAAGKVAEAREELLKVINEHPQAKEKNPPDPVLYARLRMGACYEQEKKYAEAMATYQKLADEYPDSYRGKQARTRIDELKKLPEAQPKKK